MDNNRDRQELIILSWNLRSESPVGLQPAAPQRLSSQLVITCAEPTVKSFENYP